MILKIVIMKMLNIIILIVMTIMKEGIKRKEIMAVIMKRKIIKIKEKEIKVVNNIKKEKKELKVILIII